MIRRRCQTRLVSNYGLWHGCLNKVSVSLATKNILNLNVQRGSESHPSHLLVCFVCPLPFPVLSQSLVHLLCTIQLINYPLKLLAAVHYL